MPSQRRPLAPHALTVPNQDTQTPHTDNKSKETQGKESKRKGAADRGRQLEDRPGVQARTITWRPITHQASQHTSWKREYTDEKHSTR